MGLREVINTVNGIESQAVMAVEKPRDACVHIVRWSMIDELFLSK